MTNSPLIPASSHISPLPSSYLVLTVTELKFLTSCLQNSSPIRYSRYFSSRATQVFSCVHPYHIPHALSHQENHVLGWRISRQTVSQQYNPPSIGHGFLIATGVDLEESIPASRAPASWALLSLSISLFLCFSPTVLHCGAMLLNTFKLWTYSCQWYEFLSSLCRLPLIKLFQKGIFRTILYTSISKISSSIFMSDVRSSSLPFLTFISIIFNVQNDSGTYWRQNFEAARPYRMFSL